MSQRETPTNVTAGSRFRNYFWKPGAPGWQNALRIGRAVLSGPVGALGGAVRSTVAGEAREGLSNFVRGQREGGGIFSRIPRFGGGSQPGAPLPSYFGQGGTAWNQGAPASNWEQGTNYSNPVIDSMGRDVAAMRGNDAQNYGPQGPGYGVLANPNPGMSAAQAFGHYNLGGGGTGGIGAASGLAGSAMSAAGGGSGAGGAPWWSSAHTRTGTRIK